MWYGWLFQNSRLVLARAPLGGNKPVVTHQDTYHILVETDELMVVADTEGSIIIYLRDKT